MKRYYLLTLSLFLFLLGNIVYIPYINIPWYVRSIFSEMFFVFMYTIIDFGNFKYRYKFAIPHIILLLMFLLPIFSFLFYSVVAQFFSVIIAIIAIIVNTKVLYILYNKGFARILCTRTGTVLASIIEVILFSSILHLGAKGAILMIILRPIYITIIPKLIFKK